MGEGAPPSELPQAGPAAPTSAFKVHTNYVALPALEAFRIEYWRLEEAKIRRQPAEKQLSRQIAVVVGGGSGIGREVALLAAERGAHVVVADRDLAGAEAVTGEVRAIAGKEFAVAVSVDICNRETIREALAKAIGTFGGIDILINTAAIFPASTRRRHQRCAVGVDARCQRYGELPADRRSIETIQGTGSAGQRRLDQLGQRGGFQAWQRGI